MISRDRKKMGNHEYMIFRCVEAKEMYASGVVEGLPGVYMVCGAEKSTKPVEKGKEVMYCPSSWEFEPYTGFKEGSRYLVKRNSLKNLKFEHYVKAEPIFKVKDQPFDMIPYEEKFGDDTLEEVSEFLEFDKKESEQLRIYQKAFGFSYKINNYEFIVKTRRSNWRYNILKKALYHEGHFATNKTGSSKGVYLQGWHRQKTGYLDGPLDAVSYIATHDYGITSELQGSAGRVENKDIKIL